MLFINFIFNSMKKIFSSSTLIDCLVQSLAPHLETIVLGPMKGLLYEAHIWASRTVVICVQICQIVSVQTQKGNFCKVAWYSLTGVLPDPDLAVMKSSMFTCFLCLLSLPQINNTLVCLAGSRFWSHKVIKTPGSALLIIWRLFSFLFFFLRFFPPPQHQWGL